MKRVFFLSLLLVLIVTNLIIHLTETNQVQAASISSARSGSWSSPSTWQGGRVPITGDVITITAGHTVTYDIQSDAVLGSITIHGTLAFSRTTNTRLKTNDNIIVENGGFLDMGTPSSPIPKAVKAEVTWVLTQTQVNAYVGGFGFEPTDKGLWAMTGSKWETHGASLTRTWSKLAENAAVGSNTVVVENDVTDWYTGGTVVVTQTSNPGSPGVDSSGRPTINYRFENETRTITSLEKLTDGKTRITLNSPFTYAHEGTAPFKGEVGLLTRNVVFKTELLGVSESTLQSDIGARKFAHTMWMSGAKGNAQYAEFKYMGNYKKLSRYPIHTHQMQESSRGMIIRGNGIWYTGFRWIDLHTSYGILVEDNVGYNTSSTGYFPEADRLYPNPGSNLCEMVGKNVDLVFTHNIGIDARSVKEADKGGPGEYSRTAAFWPHSGASGESYLGNVAVGIHTGNTGATDTSGFHFPELAGCSTDVTGVSGTIGNTFVKNESHSNMEGGIATWQNNSTVYEIIDTSSWRNGIAGFGTIGAYTGEFNIFNAKILENGRFGVISTIIDAFLQDSLITGLTTDRSIDDFGDRIAAYLAPQLPQKPHWNVRNTYRNLKDGYSHRHDRCGDNEGDDPASEKKIGTTDCSPDFSYVVGNSFENVITPIDFGWQANANTWHKVSGLKGVDVSLQGNFYLNRKDQNVAANQGPESSRIVGNGSNSTLNTLADALKTPIAIPWADLPPKIESFTVTMNGKVATMKATVSDDKNPNPTVEFYVDWTKVGERSGSSEITVDLSNHPRRYAYLYARAFDGTSVFTHQVPDPSFPPGSGRTITVPYAQRAYSDVVELGPEVILAGPIPPSSIFAVSSFDKLHVSLDRVEKIILHGSSLTGNLNVTFLKSGLSILTFPSIPGGGDTLELDFATKDLTSVPLGEYTVQVTRLSDGQTITHLKTFVFTRLGDLWRLEATELDEQKRDGKIDFHDVSRLLSKWNTSDPEADINPGPSDVSQGRVDIYDANKLMANWTRD